MTKPLLPPLARNRHIALTIGTGVIALLTAIYLIGAPLDTGGSRGRTDGNMVNLASARSMTEVEQLIRT